MPKQIGLLSMDFFIALMIAFFVIGILSQILIGILYQHMIEQAENMQITENKILKQFKQDFKNCYELNDGMTNVPVFVEKFINRLQFGKLSLNMLRNLSGQCMFLSVLTAGLGICRGFAAGSSFWSLLPYYIITFIGLYLYFSVLSVADSATRRGILKTNLIDYLENHMISRLEGAREMAAVKERELEEALPEGLADDDEESTFAKVPGDRIPFEKKRMPRADGLRAQEKKPAGLDWTGGMADAGSQQEKPILDREKQEELAELLKDLLS